MWQSDQEPIVLRTVVRFKIIEWMFKKFATDGNGVSVPDEGHVSLFVDDQFMLRGKKEDGTVVTLGAKGDQGATGATGAKGEQGENCDQNILSGKANLSGASFTGSVLTTDSLIAENYVYANKAVISPIDLGVTGISVNASDAFTVDENKILSHYGLSWKNMSYNAGGATACLSGFSGIEFYTQGTRRMIVRQDGSLVLSGLLRAQGNILVSENLSVYGTISLGSYEVATLPEGSNGSTAYVVNGRKQGESAGAGTGVPVYYSGGAWRTYYDNAAVNA